MTNTIIAGIAVGITAIISGSIFWILSKQTKVVTVKVAIVDDSAYWKMDDKWYTAPVITREETKEIDSNNKHEIDLDKATPEQINFLMEILERFES